MTLPSDFVTTISAYSEDAINTDGLPFIAYAKCGDLEIGVLPVAVGEYHLIGAQIENDQPECLYQFEFKTEAEALVAFGKAIQSEYAAA